jgi:DNA-binding response OmpR family regulator
MREVFAMADKDWRGILPSLRLPSDPPTLLTDSTSRPRVTADPKRVLIVEDNIDAARTATLLVSDMGHDAEYAINGYVALSIARRFQPHIVLLDLGLPGLDGFEVCRRLKRNPEFGTPKVVVVTGYSAEEYREYSRAAGSDLHLIKPVPTSVLEEVLG